MQYFATIFQLPNGTLPQPTPTNQEKQKKLQENYENIIVMFKKLKLLYEKCNEMCGGMEQNLTEVKKHFFFLDRDICLASGQNLV